MSRQGAADDRATPAAHRPLAGLLVADLSRHLPGPLAARLLADLGARVVKVEEPRRGDPLRAAPPRPRGHRDGALAGLLLAGVESVALDLAEPAARRILDRLLGRSDVLLESFRPGRLERFGPEASLAPAALAERHPHLVVCSLSGWGDGGPYRERAGHDLTYGAAAGLVAATGEVPPAPIADLVGAWSAVASILAALVARGATGAGDGDGAPARGVRIDASLFDAAVHANLAGWAQAAGGRWAGGSWGDSPAEPHDLAGALPCYRIYPTADGGRLAVAALEPHFWRRFCAVAGRPDLVRLQYRREAGAHRRVAEMVAGRRLAEWRRLLAGEDLPVEPVASAREAARHPQGVARGVLASGPDGAPRLAYPARFDGERPAAGPAAAVPPLGADTERLVAELGLGAEVPRGARRRRRAGIGPRFSLRRLLGRWIG